MCLFEAINQSSTLLFHMDVIHLMSIHPVAHLNKTISLFKKKGKKKQQVILPMSQWLKLEEARLSNADLMSLNTLRLS